MNLLSACGLSRRRRSTTMGYCLPDSLSLLVCNPETASRVTLAALGIGFQPNHVGCLVVLLFVILIHSTKSQNNNIKNLNFRKLFSNERTLDASHFVEGLSCGFDLDYKFFFHSFAKPAKRYFCFG